MQTDIVEEIDLTPKFYSKKCKFISFIITFFLQYTTFLAGLIAYYLYDYFVALLVLILTFIIVGIIRSKLRNSSIPSKQREYYYSDKAIAKWFSAKEFCYDEIT